MRPSWSNQAATGHSLLLAFVSCSLAASSTSTKAPQPTLDPCTAHSTLTGSNFDLRPLILHNLTAKSHTGTNESYHARGYDYGYNFTINICAPAIEAQNFTDVADVSKRLWANVSAYYKDEKNDVVYSLGLSNNIPTVRGRKVLLNYTEGSYCPDLDEYGVPMSTSSVHSSIEGRKLIGDDDEDLPRSNRSKGKTGKATQRRKNTLISFICDTSPSLLAHPRISFLGTPDSCSYIFEVRSRWACAGTTPTTNQKGTVGPGGVFAMIVGIGFFAYLIGGIVYQRSVMHQRGWRQLPNHALWTSIWSFISVSL